MTYDNEYEDTSDEPTVTEPTRPLKPHNPIMLASLPLEIAKAMKPIVIGKYASASGDALKQILCENYNGFARYVATNGNVMLTIDTDLPGPTKPAVFTAYKRWDSESEAELPGVVQTVLDSKGYAPGVHGDDADSAMHRFPDYKILSLDGAGKVEQAGFNSGYLWLLQTFNTALKLGRDKIWSVRFVDDNTSPTVWEPSKVSEWELHNIGGFNVTSIQFVVMPVRLD